MRGYTDDWVETQFRRKVERYRLPGPRTLILPAAAERVPENLRTLLTAESVGRPLLALVDTAELWTLLGTRAVCCLDRGAVAQVLLEDIQQVTAANMDQTPREKNQYLELRDRQGQIYTIWAPPGPEYFSFWSLLKWLVELPPRRENLAGA